MQNHVKSLLFIVFTLPFLSLLPSETSLLAQENSQETVMEEIDVRGQVRREELRSTSATVLTGQDVQSRIYYQPIDLLKMAPGIFIGRYAESAIAPEIYIRGFSGGHGGAEITMYMDGIPLHDNGHATAYVDSNSIMPIEIESIEIIKGPASVYYGQHSGGGAIPIQSIKRGNHTKLNLRYGSYNDIDVTGLWGREIGNFSHIYAFELYHTDGYRENSDWDKKNFSGRWTYTFSDNFAVSLNLRAYQSEWNSAGYISKLLSSSDKDWVNDGSGEGNGGKRDRYDARLWANWFINDYSQLTYYLYGTTLEHTRYQINQHLYGRDPSNGSLQNNTHKSWGTGLTYSFNGELFEREATATFGFTYMYEKEDPNRTYPLIWGQGRSHPGAPDTLEIFTLSNPSILAEFTYQLIKPLNIRIGARYDSLEGTHRDLLQDTTRESRRHTFFSPKLGLLYTPTHWIEFYASYGKSFSAPGLSWGGAFYEGDALELSTREQFEVGLRTTLTQWLSAEAAYFRVYTDNDSTYDPQTFTATATGSSVRQGLELSVDVYPAKNLSIKANYTYNDAKYKDYVGLDWGTFQLYNYAGRRITYLPRHLTNLEIAYSPPLGFGGRLSFSWAADALGRDNPPASASGVPNPDPFRVFKSQDQGSLDLQLFYRINESYRLTLDATNLLNKKYYASQGIPNPSANYDFTYSLRPPFSVYFGLEITNP
ncbi:MAG: TonB-dependent receptor [Deltaproteobacteria bacterium]|nr:TonB-dependent receptor [Deltaproteobacteria bacterium]